MEIREKEFEEKMARGGADTLKGFCVFAGRLPPPSPAERACRFAESIMLIIESLQR